MNKNKSYVKDRDQEKRDYVHQVKESKTPKNERAQSKTFLSEKRTRNRQAQTNIPAENQINHNTKKLLERAVSQDRLSKKVLESLSDRNLRLRGQVHHLM